MNKTVIRHTIEKSKEGTYYTLPFELPDGLESFTVTYRYDKQTQGITGRKKNPCIIDLGLMDGDGRFLGWSGSARDSVTVGEFESTKGYLSQPLKGGTWQILIGAYKLNKPEVEVEYTIEFHEKRPKLYFGDLHIHTDASDGRHSCYEIAEMAKEKGLDFVALANHNNYCENFSLPKNTGITFIPAVEWTHYKGHINLFGVENPFENSFVANTKEEMQRLIEDAKKKGAVVSVNHPMCPICPYLWGDDEIYDMMEVWNGPMRPTNVRGIEKWTSLLKTGRIIPAVGGSDFHSLKLPTRIGNPVNGVWSESPSDKELLSAIRSGHSFIASSTQAPQLFLRSGDKMMGDTVFADGKTVGISIIAENAEKAKLILVTAKREEPVTADKVSVGADEVFAYVKAVGKLNQVTAITNPIYIR